MISLFRRCSFLIMTSAMLPLTVFSLSAADFNKAIAEANQKNLPASPQYNCPSVPASTHAQGNNYNNAPTATPAAPIYYAPSTPVSANPPPTTPPAASASNNNSGIVWGSPNNATKNTTNPPLMITY